MTNNSEKPWVTQGIISITLVPRIKRYLPAFDYNEDGSESGNPNHNMTKAPVLGMPTLTHDMLANWRTDPAAIPSQIPTRYTHLKKFFTYPYMVIEMTTWSATPIIIKPESWANPDATITETVALVPPQQRIVFMPQSYNARDNTTIDTNESWLPNIPGLPYPHDLGPGDDQGEYLDFATLITNFPTMAVVNNAAIGYLASNQHGIAFQQRSADWSQQRAMRSADVAFDNTAVGRQLSTDLTGISNTLDLVQTNNANSLANNSMLASGVAGVVQGAAGGATGGPPGAVIGAGMGIIGGVAGAIQTGLSTQTASGNQVARQHASQQSNKQNNNASLDIAHNNSQLSRFAARGDYGVAIAAMNAKIQDAALIQPTTSGQMGGESLNLILNKMQVSLRWKFIDDAHLVAIGEEWLRYGYMIHRRVRNIPSNFQVMTKFTYWKLSEVYIIAAPMPETFKQTIRGIFEKGVTVWGNPDDIGNIDIADNHPLSGVTL